VEIPFSLQNIRDHISIITPYKLGDYAECARIVKAFAEVGFDGCPQFFKDLRGLIEHFVANRPGSSLKCFLLWLDANKSKPLRSVVNGSN
jgi:hypothetical protein